MAQGGRLVERNVLDWRCAGSHTGSQQRGREGRGDSSFKQDESQEML